MKFGFTSFLFEDNIMLYDSCKISYMCTNVSYPVYSRELAFGTLITFITIWSVNEFVLNDAKFMMH